MYDFLSGAVFGFHTITRCMVGFVAGFIKGRCLKNILLTILWQHW